MMSTATPPQERPGGPNPHRGHNLTASMTPQEVAMVNRLLKDGMSESQVATAKQYHRDNIGRGGTSFARLLVELGLATEGEVAQWIAEHHGWRVIGSNELKPSGDALSLLSNSVARARCALPISRRNGSAVIAVGDPELPQFVQVRHALAGINVEFVVAPFSDILAAVEDSYAVAVTVSSENELEQFVELMFREAALSRTSDIHVIPGEKSVAVKFRQDGELQQWRVVDGSVGPKLSAQIKLSSKRGKDGRTRLSNVGGLDVSQRFIPQDASAMRVYGSRSFSLRYSVIPAVTGESIVIRVLDQDAQVGDLGALGMLDDHAAIYKRTIKLPYGLILNVGPTGHGKSTTLASAVQYIDVHRKRVLTIEDPVEYRLRNVTQCEAQPDAGFGFAEALRAFMRHNPNVIILGEMRDTQTAKAGLSLSLTGHLLLSTAHANTALGGLVRMLELDADAAMLAASCKLMLSQRLVPRLCPQCRRPHELAQEWMDRYRHLFTGAMKQGLLGGVTLFEAGGGCEHCKGRGFTGRIALYELRSMRPVVASELSTKKREFDPVLAEKFYAESFGTGKLDQRNLEQDGMLKAALGILSPEEVLAATVAEI